VQPKNRLSPCGNTINLGLQFSQNAGIAQLVEQLICNQQVVGSSPTAGLAEKPAVFQVKRLEELKFNRLDCLLVQ
jgi:hypothetical protein